jgi:hypothetical protein
MKKTFLKFGAFIVAGSMFVGCNKDEDEVKTIEPEFPTEYSELTVAQNKTKLEDNGVSLISEITTFKNSSGVQTSIAFTQHMEGSTVPENIGGRVSTNSGVKLLKLLSSFGQGKTSPSKTLKGLRISEDDGFTSFKTAYDSVIGVYTYNKAADAWTYERTGDKIVFKFPSTEEGTVNNAQYTIYGLETVTINSDLGGDEYNGDYPTALKTELLVDNVKKMEYSFSAAYNSDGDPSSIKVSLTIDAYTLAYEISNSTNEAKFDYSLKEGNEILLAYGARATGNFSSTAMEGMENAGDVITTSSAYFQIKNIKFSGEINADALLDALAAATTKEQELAAWNANYKLVVFYDDTKKKIADSEFYLTEEEYTEWEMVWNSETQEYEWVEHTAVRESIEIRLVFADQSKSDLATYTDTGFEDLKSSFENFIEDLEND